MTTVREIIAELVKGKEKILTDSYDKVKALKKIKSVDVGEKYESELKEEKLQTGTLIDALIGGGLEAGSSMVLYGEYGSGKTQTCITMAVLCPTVVIYIDTEGSFRASRIKQICDERGLDYKAVFAKIKLFQPSNWIEQMYILDSLPSPIDVGKIGLIIVDSLTKRFRGVEFSGRESLSTKQPLVREYMLRLEEISKTYGSGLIYTTQIYESPTANPFLPAWTGQKPVGGASLLHQPDYVVFLRKSRGTVRIARLIDASWRPLRERPFMITVKGIENLPETKKSETLVEKLEKYEGKQTAVLNDPKKKKKVVTEGELPSPEGEANEI